MDNGKADGDTPGDRRNRGVGTRVEAETSWPPCTSSLRLGDIHNMYRLSEVVGECASHRLGGAPRRRVVVVVMLFAIAATERLALSQLDVCLRIDRLGHGLMEELIARCLPSSKVPVGGQPFGHGRPSVGACFLTADRLSSRSEVLCRQSSRPNSDVDHQTVYASSYANTLTVRRIHVGTLSRESSRLYGFSALDELP
jgi:hypothetical protein